MLSLVSRKKSERKRKAARRGEAHKGEARRAAYRVGGHNVAGSKAQTTGRIVVSCLESEEAQVKEMAKAAGLADS